MTSPTRAELEFEEPYCSRPKSVCETCGRKHNWFADYCSPECAKLLNARDHGLITDEDMHRLARREP